MRRIEFTGQFKKDYKLAQRRNLPEQELQSVIHDLACDIELTPDKRDHALVGKYAGSRECHIRPDWLLIYSKTDSDIHLLTLIRTGSHSDLFR